MQNYLSVSEYAKLHGKDSGNIRRHLASGRIKGLKVGNQWIIEENTPYPDDKRETSGIYKNWKERLAFNKHKILSKSISKMIEDLSVIYGDQLLKIVLYGSYARGTQTHDSDVDIAVIVRNKPSTEITNAMIDCVASYELECGKVLSVIDINAGNYEKWKNILPFYRNIEKEGILLWKAAA